MQYPSSRPYVNLDALCSLLLPPVLQNEARDELPRIVLAYTNVCSPTNKCPSLQLGSCTAYKYHDRDSIPALAHLNKVQALDPLFYIATTLQQHQTHSLEHHGEISHR